MTPLETIVREELERLRTSVESGLTDPAERAALATMAADLALMPVRMARGEDVTDLVASLKAEGANRSLKLRTRAETAAQRTWINIAQRLLVGTLTGALA